MKYSLYKELLDEKNILSHVFFNCAQDFIKEIADKNKGKTKEQIEKRKIDIELKIDGRVCDPKLFFDALFEQYAEQVKAQATKLVKEQTSEKFQKISEELENYNQITKDWANDISWKYENPFIVNKK